MDNLFCNNRDLRNEASVEAIFVDRLLRHLNYPDDRIRRKESIEDIVIGRGRRRETYKPDYVLFDSSGQPIIVVDAKAPSINPEEYHYQVSSYALHINQTYIDKNPVLYTVLTNGHLFFVYPWDNDRPVFFLRFEDFVEGNEKYLELRSNLSYSVFNQVAATKDVFDYKRPGLTELIRVFNDCHNLIWKKEKINPTDAFYEFAKIMFIKIREDAKVHSLIDSGKEIEMSDFVFSTEWIEQQSRIEQNPFDAILFRQIQEDLERQIRRKSKKRIFEEGERLNLRASTTYEVVRKLQNFDLYGIDEDLNGRMFETFLNATIRGKDLGQFFTPRGVVHYMVETSPIFIKRDDAVALAERIPYVLDGCCGSGGFLIDTMAQMIRQIRNLSSLTDRQRVEYSDEAINRHLFGIEANSKIARICRLNMYLHGDGGSKIFKTDTLDSEFETDAGMAEEEIEGVNELKSIIKNKHLLFDVVVTNPPFSMKYSSSDSYEKRILEQYEIARTSSGSIATSEKSNVLFLERYKNLLKPGSGELLTIIDDTVLNGVDSQKYRDFILENFIIIQVVSLPFNAFFRADANVKTSMIHLRRKAPGENQGSVFMAITNNVGHDDHCRDTPARNNFPLITNKFLEWKSGRRIKDTIYTNEDPDEPLSCPLQVFTVPARDINPERLDAFYYAPELKELRKRLIDLERKGKILLRRGSDFNIIPEATSAEVSSMGDTFYKYIEIGDVTRDGTIVKFREDSIENLPTRARLFVKERDVIFAKNNSSRGTTVIIPRWFDSSFVTTGFIGIRPTDTEEALLLWNFMESEAFRKQVYYLAITASQPEVRKDIFENEMIIAWPKEDSIKRSMVENAKKAEKARKALRASLLNATSNVINLLEE